MHAVRDAYAVHDGTSHVPSMGKTTIPACKDTSSLFLKAFSVGSRNFTTRGRLISRYRCSETPSSVRCFEYFFVARKEQRLTGLKSAVVPYVREIGVYFVAWNLHRHRDFLAYFRTLTTLNIICFREEGHGGNDEKRARQSLPWKIGFLKCIAAIGRGNDGNCRRCRRGWSIRADTNLVRLIKFK